MKNLIIYYSPIPQSFTNQLAEEVKAIYRSRGEELVVRNLEQIRFNPILSFEEIELAAKGNYLEDVAHEQEYITWADNLIFIYPLYQYSMPAVMKGYIDRVLVQNFSHNYNSNGSINPLLKGKTLSLLCPMGASFKVSSKNGDIEAINHITKSIFEIRGFTIKNICYFDFEQREQQILALKNSLIAENV